MKKEYLAVAAILATGLILVPQVYLAIVSQNSPTYPFVYTYKIVSSFPHNVSSFTQGLVFEDGFLFEGTGLYGSSTLRKVELETGKTIQLHALSDEYFGEGITVFGDKIIQLTWESHKGYVYDKQSFILLSEFSYPSEGWGITNDGSRLIMSDGSSTLSFLDPITFETVGQIQVHDADAPVNRLNELEFINGDIFANVLQEDRIAIIDIQTGQVKAWINLDGLYTSEISDVDDVLNGIAYDTKGDRLFVTGKRWSLLFEIDLVPA